MKNEKFSILKILCTMSMFLFFQVVVFSQWQQVGKHNPAGTASVYPTSMVFDSKGSAYVGAIVVGTNTFMYVMKFDGTTWIQVGERLLGFGAFDKPFIIIDHNDVPYVEFGSASHTILKFNGRGWEKLPVAPPNGYNQTTIADNHNNLYFIYAYGRVTSVKKYDGTKWSFVGKEGFTSEQAIPNIAVDKNGKLYTVVAATKGLAILTFSGATWDTVGTVISNAVQGTCSLDETNTPYICYVDKNNNVTTEKFTDGSWKTVGSPSFAANADRFYFTISGKPYVFIYNSSTYTITVMNFDRQQWNISGKMTIPESTKPFCFGVTNAQPHVFYANPSAHNDAVVKKMNGSSWSTVGEEGFIGKTVTFNSLAFVGTTPHIAYVNPPAASVTQFDGANWNLVGPAGFTDPDPGYTEGVSNITLAFDKDAIPYVAYQDLYGKFDTNGGVRDLRYASVMKFYGTKWNYVGPRQFTKENADGLSFLIDKTNTPYVAFIHDSAVGVMGYKNGTWNFIGQKHFGVPTN